MTTRQQAVKESAGRSSKTKATAQVEPVALRDMIAIAAMQARRAGSLLSPSDIVAKSAYEDADAMLAERAKPKAGA